jgi:NADPH:quinone reductase-like Zn-dependent oxidoreductase
MKPKVLEVNRSELYELRIVPSPERELAQGEIRVSVSSFGLTANNVTYAVFGEMMAYWRFFPAPGGPEWGVVPVWGFGEVVESRVGGIDVGERIYGYLPMATELVMAPERVGSGSFVDAAAHRRELPAVYNRYARCGGDPGYTVELEDAQMLLQPLFTTSFLIDDFLADSEFFGAGRIVLTSASSKTAFGTAHLLHRRGGLEIVGLTSASNAPFVEDLGCYDRVLTYDQIERLGDQDGDAVLLDFAGDQQTVQLIHHRLGVRLRHSAVIGGTHWDAERSAGERPPGPRQEFFFAPERVQRRTAEWGPDGFGERLGARWREFVPFALDHLDIRHHQGLEEAGEVYSSILGGTAPAGVADVVGLD